MPPPLPPLLRTSARSFRCLLQGDALPCMSCKPLGGGPVSAWTQAHQALHPGLCTLAAGLAGERRGVGGRPPTACCCTTTTTTGARCLPHDGINGAGGGQTRLPHLEGQKCAAEGPCHRRHAGRLVQSSLIPHASCLTDRPLPPLLPGRREYVVQVLLKVVDGTTVDDAVNIMQVGAAGQCRWACLRWPSWGQV